MLDYIKLRTHDTPTLYFWLQRFQLWKDFFKLHINVIAHFIFTTSSGLNSICIWQPIYWIKNWKECFGFKVSLKWKGFQSNVCILIFSAGNLDQFLLFTFFQMRWHCDTKIQTKLLGRIHCFRMLNTGLMSLNNPLKTIIEMDKQVQKQVPSYSRKGSGTVYKTICK